MLIQGVIYVHTIFHQNWSRNLGHEEVINIHKLLHYNMKNIWYIWHCFIPQLETKDSRPILACYICYARLHNCYQLRLNCLRSEELFSQMLSSNVVSVYFIITFIYSRYINKNRTKVFNHCWKGFNQNPGC